MTDEDLTAEYGIRHPNGTIHNPTSQRSEALRLLEKYRGMWTSAELVTRHVAHGEWVADGVEPALLANPPRRGDQFEQWLKTQRDEFERRDSVWPVLDYLLDQYRLHADTGTPLDQHVCENGTPDDCTGCYEASKEQPQ